MAEPRAASRPTIQSIQVMRGLAAVAVAVYHTHLILAQPQYGGIEAFGAVASRGWLGVNYFFVLSGFIIMHAHARDIGVPQAVPRYVWNRLARVYPVYWIVLTLYLAGAYAGLGAPGFSWAPANIASAYALVPLTPELSIPLQVAWTLFYEVTFYAVFTLLILNRAGGILAFALWTCAIVVASLVLGRTEFGWLNAWNLYFLVGIGVFHAARVLPERAGGAILAAGLALLVLALATLAGERTGAVPYGGLGLVAFSLPFALVILGCVLMERARPWRLPGWLLTLGAASYAIYLVHSPAISLVATLNRKFALGALPAPAVFTATALVSVVAGVIVHLALERPVLQALRRIGPRRRTHEPRPVGVGA